MKRLGFGRLVGTLGAAYLTLAAVIAFYGVARPERIDHATLRAAGLDGTPVLIGLSTAQRSTADGMRFEDSRHYLLLPDSLRERALWVVTQENAGAPFVRRSTRAFHVVAALLALSLASLWLLRPRRRRLR